MFIAGVAASALYFKAPNSQKQGWNENSPLAPSTARVIEKLNSPLEIDYYSLLDTSSVPGSVQAFASRVDRLLARYQEESGGKIKINRHTLTNSSAADATQAGLKAFNADKGDASFLGLSISKDGQREVISHLSPEYESAVESDLTRAIARTAQAGTTSSTVASPVTPAIQQSVNQLIPDPNAITVEQGTKILRDAALNEFRQATETSQSQQNELEQRYIQAQSEDEKQRALEELKKFQAEQTKELKRIAAKSAAQLEAFKQAKGK